MYKIVDVFYSLQGEGSHAGVASIFIRFYGCNLSCYFCDEEKHKGEFETYTKEELLEKIKGFPSRQIVITGGEPSIYDLNGLIDFFQEMGYYVCVESNGYSFENIKNADWITYSPKDWNHLEKEGFSEYKFIVSTVSDVSKILEIKSEKPIFIQPENHMETPNVVNTKYCIELIQENPHLRLSVQLHKYLGLE